MSSDKVTTLSTVMADYPHTLPLKNGQIRSDLVAQLYRDEAGDQGVQADGPRAALRCQRTRRRPFTRRKPTTNPLVLLPADGDPLSSLGCMLHNAERGRLTPADLVGRRVGVRLFANHGCSGCARILQNDYGVDVSRVRWITFEDACRRVQDPAGVERAAEGKNMTKMLQEEPRRCDLRLRDAGRPAAARRHPIGCDVRAPGTTAVALSRSTT